MLVYDAEPTLNQHWFNVLFLPGNPKPRLDQCSFYCWHFPLNPGLAALWGVATMPQTSNPGIPPYKARRRYLITLQVSRCCLLDSQETWIHAPTHLAITWRSEVYAEIQGRCSHKKLTQIGGVWLVKVDKYRSTTCLRSGPAAVIDHSNWPSSDAGV